jgi:hypothetical protein
MALLYSSPQVAGGMVVLSSLHVISKGPEKGLPSQFSDSNFLPVKNLIGALSFYFFHLFTFSLIIPPFLLYTTLDP